MSNIVEKYGEPAGFTLVFRHHALLTRETHLGAFVYVPNASVRDFNFVLSLSRVPLCSKPRQAFSLV